MNEILGTTLHHMRKTAKISQAEMGKLLDVHQTAVCRIEQGAQSLTPEQLVILSKFFSIRIDSLIAGDVDYWKIAEHFGQPPPVPECYTQLPFSKTRELLPLLKFLKVSKGESFTRNTLATFNLDEVFLRNPDMPLGVNCKLDLMRHLITTGILNKRALKSVTDQSRSEDVQGFLHHVYETQESPIALTQSWLLNSHHYEQNFSYMIENLGQSHLEFSISPQSHMRDVPYKDEVLGDMLCEYKKNYFKNFSIYISGKPLLLAEKQCHFHGAASCVYELKVA